MCSALRELQEWYFAQCDGDWEHGYGIDIGNIDNPGWSISLDLEGTSLKDVPFAEYKESYDDDLDWIICVKSDTKFGASGGPLKLERMIEIFLDWAKTAEQPLTPVS